MYSEDCWGFRVSNFIWLSRVSRPLLYSYIITTLITHPLMFPPINLNNNLQPSSATSPKPSWILSSNHHQYCPPTTFYSLRITPYSLPALRSLPPYATPRSSIWIPVLSHFYETSRTFYKKNPENQSWTVKKPKKKYDGHGEKLWSEEKKKKEKNEQRTLINLHEVDVRNLIFMNWNHV